MKGTAKGLGRRLKDAYQTGADFLGDRINVGRVNATDTEGWTPDYPTYYYDTKGRTSDPDFISTDPALGYVDPAIAHTAHFIRNRPATSAAIGLGGIAANAMLNHPVQGVIDAVTFNTLNLRSDGVAAETPVMPVTGITPLSADQLASQLEYLNKNVATDMVTINSLRQLQQAGYGERQY